MLNFMDYVQQAFSAASRWDRDNSYGALNATARALLDFPTPTTGITLHFASLASPNFATFYELANTGAVDGSLSYLYSSLPLEIVSKSADLPLRRMVPGYRQLRDFYDLHPPSLASDAAAEVSTPKSTIRPPTLLYGRLYLPTSHLEALYLRRFSPTSQLKVSCVSSAELRNGGSILFLLSRDYGKYSTEWLYSTDSALLGVRALYNFGPDPRKPSTSSTSTPTSTSTTTSAASALSSVSASAPEGRFSAGGEVYYGILNKSGGASVGLRFATLPQHTGFPYTMTLTLNPLMGNLSAAYAVRAGSALALCSRFNFNFYSYESEYQLGVELWRRKVPRAPVDDGLDWARAILQQPGRSGWGEWRAVSVAPSTSHRVTEAMHALSDAGGGITGDGGVLMDSSPPSPFPPPPAVSQREAVVPFPGEQQGDQSWVDNPNGFADRDTAGVLKARLNQDGNVAFVWEGRVKELLCAAGVTLDWRKREQIFRGVGLEVQYSS